MRFSDICLHPFRMDNTHRNLIRGSQNNVWIQHRKHYRRPSQHESGYETSDEASSFSQKDDIQRLLEHNDKKSARASRLLTHFLGIILHPIYATNYHP